MIEIQDVLIVITSNDWPHFHNLLGDGDSFGLNISYEIQDEPKGIAEV